MSEWRSWQGGNCPTHPEAMVRLRYRGVGRSFESMHEYKADRMRWSHKDEAGDIVAYIVVSVPQEIAA